MTDLFESLVIFPIRGVNDDVLSVKILLQHFADYSTLEKHETYYMYISPKISVYTCSTVGNEQLYIFFAPDVELQYVFVKKFGKGGGGRKGKLIHRGCEQRLCNVIRVYCAKKHINLVK